MIRFAVVSLALRVLGGAHAGLDWPMVNGCRERTSFASEETLLRAPFDLRVDYPVEASNASYVDGVLYANVASDSNIVIAFDTLRNVELWRFGIPGSAGAASVVPAVGESLVVCGGQRGLGLHALDRATGQQRWFKPMSQSLYARNPILDGDRVYLIADSTYCVEAATGATLWTNSYRNQGTPAVDDSSVYVPFGGAAMALNKFTGEVRWASSGHERVIAAVVVGEPYVYVYHNGLIQAVRTRDGGVDWAIQPDAPLAWLNQGAVSISDDALFYVAWADSAGCARLVCHDRFTGALRWRHVFDGEGVFSPTVANGIVYVTTWSPRRVLLGFDVETGAVAFEDTTALYWYQPIVGDHTLLVPYDEGTRAFKNLVVAGEHASLRIVLLGASPNPCRGHSA